MTTYISPEHRQALLAQAITDEVIDSSGIRSTPKGLEFPWSDVNGTVVWQTRPDNPRTDADGRKVKYEFSRGARIPLGQLRDEDQTSPVAFVEGTRQGWAFLSHAPAHMAVYSMAGCWGWKSANLPHVDGREVYVAVDADLSSNPDVFAATEAFARKLKLSGAKVIRYIETTGEGSDGIDDVLAAMPEERRANALRTWLSVASEKLPKRPKAKRPAPTDEESDAMKLFRQRDKPLHFQPRDGAQMVLNVHPAAVTREGTIALYKNGVFSVDADAVMCTLALKLGNMYSPSYVKATEHMLTALLTADGRILPERVAEPLLNCPNGMVDLRTGQMQPHDPAFLSHVQTAVDYDASMATPVYDAWLRQSLRQADATDADVEALISGLEETAGTMLDPTRTPGKAIFLFGPSKSGKSTFLRLLKAVAGVTNTSAVTLHQLVEDQFASANLYGKMLNVAADLSNKHVADLSVFKMITGEDVIQANRKYGKQFSFTNQAMIAFSANELPTVSEASQAYVERMWPVNFPNSFAGREDKTIEAKIMAELPGILARWVKAYGRVLGRGGYSAPDQATRTEFAAKSDRVVQFFQDQCTLIEARFGQTLSDEQCTGRRDVSILFNEWAQRNGGSAMGERAFFQRMAQIDGVVEVKKTNRGRAYNVVVAKADDDLWGDAAEPVADPIPASGVTAEWVSENPWQAPVMDVEGFPASVDADPVNVPESGVQGVNGHLTAESSFLDFNDGLFS